jgi:hypothetical protein
MIEHKNTKKFALFEVGTFVGDGLVDAILVVEV